MKELKMTGNCLKGTRPLLSFDASFDTQPYWSLLKELMTQVHLIILFCLNCTNFAHQIDIFHPKESSKKSTFL